MSSFQTMRRRRERELELLGLIEEVLQENPAFAEEIRAALPGREDRAITPIRPRKLPPPPPKKSGRPRGKSAHTHANTKKIIEFLTKAGEWRSTPQVLEGTGLTKPQFFHAVHSNKIRFEMRQDPEFMRRQQWRIRT